MPATASPRPGWRALVFTLAFILPATACQVPVFRFALERWVADRYEVVVNLPGDEPGDAERAIVDFLKESAENEEILPNFFVRVETPQSGAGTDANSEAETETGSLAVYYPRRYPAIAAENVPPIWSGALTLENARKLVDSPARRELVKRILSGESATWVVVQSGNPEKDQSAVKTMAEALEEGQNVLEIPDGVVSADDAPDAGFISDPDNILQSHVPLKIGFSVLEIARNDPAEELFLPMLLNLEADLSEYAGEPMVFPVFGRGRALEPLIGKGISRDNVLDYAGYLCGACSCEVKDQNPGMDLLVAANWDAALQDSTIIIDKVLPPLEGTGVLTAATTPTQAMLTAEPAKSSPLAVLGATIGLVVCVIALGSFLVLKRRTT